jgi:ornithine carbamoyltransferase
MKHFIRLTDCSQNDMREIFEAAQDFEQNGFHNFLQGKTVVMFFPASSIRTRVSFEKGVYLAGGQVILFPTETLDKKESLEDVCGYLRNWADFVVVRHRDIRLIAEMAAHLDVPVINAMTDENHPCEITSDLYALSKMRADLTKDRYLFVGRKCNIGQTWREAAKLFSLDFVQCCPHGFEMPETPALYDIAEAMRGRDIVLTDSLPGAVLPEFQGYQVTAEQMRLANPGAVLNPCPPFYRGEEVSADVIASEFFVGYAFKKCLTEVQMAIIRHCM